MENERQRRLAELEVRLTALANAFDGAADQELDFDQPWLGVQRAFAGWMSLRQDVEEVSSDEELAEERCRHLYLSIESMTRRVADAVKAELANVRVVRTKLHQLGEQQIDQSARAIDIRG